MDPSDQVDLFAPDELSESKKVLNCTQIFFHHSSFRKTDDAIMKTLRGTIPPFAAEYIRRLLLSYAGYRRIQLCGVDIQMDIVTSILEPDTYLRETLLDVYVARLVKLNHPMVHFLPTTFLNMKHALIRHPVPLSLEMAYVVPICRSSHWILASVSARDRKILIMDSLMSDKPSTKHYQTTYLQTLYSAFSTRHNTDIEAYEVDFLKTETQKDGWNCAVHVMRAMKAIAVGELPRPFKDGINERLIVLWEMLFGLVE